MKTGGDLPLLESVPNVGNEKIGAEYRKRLGSTEASQTGPVQGCLRWR